MEEMLNQIYVSFAAVPDNLNKSIASCRWEDWYILSKIIQIKTVEKFFLAVVNLISKKNANH